MRNFTLEDISQKLDQLKNKNLLCIGDSVIDKYIFVSPKGRAMKDPVLSNRFESEENYAGGVLAVANHLSSYVNKVTLVTLIGDQNSQLEFIKDSLYKNVELKTFTKENSPTIIKARYIDFYRGNKLFKVEYMNDSPISKELSNEIEKYLSEELPKYDLTISLDYDHGFMNKKIREILQAKSNFLTLNVQLNSSNFGFNYVTRYKNPNFITMNEIEMRLPLMMKFENIEEVVDKFYKEFGYSQFLVTTGKEGCIFFKEGKKYSSSALTKNVIDTVGAGDAVFALASLFSYLGADNKMIPFVSNCAGAIASNILGNKEFVTKDKLINFIREI
jgi:rfaE bifunctional protein kinase chain/domain